MLTVVSPAQREAVKEFRLLGERLAEGGLEEEQLSAVVVELPLLTEELLDSLAVLAQEQGHINPRLGWALAAVGDATAVRQQVDLRLQGRAAWYLGRAANNYFRPRLALSALRRAKDAFEILDDKAWIAACNWQRRVLAWAHPNLQECEIEVRDALDLFSVKNSPLAVFSDECRLTLAYVQTLIGYYDEAFENLAVCKQAFEELEDQIRLVQCTRIRCNVLGRQTNFDEALTRLDLCLNQARAIPAPVEEAHVLLQMASVLIKRPRIPGDVGEAENVFLQASGLFRTLDLPFWEALCRSVLADIYISTGRLSEAGEMLAYCRTLFREYEVDAPLAGALIGSGWLETYRANYYQGLDYLAQAESICEQLGNLYMRGVCFMHLGEIYLEMGRYQQGLHYLEASNDIFRQLNSYARIAECGLRLARCWVYLGRPDRAIEILKQVELNGKKAKQGSIFPYLYIRMAEAQLAAGRQKEGAGTLRKGVRAATHLNDKTGAALAQRLLGETLCELGQLEESAQNLKSAEETFYQVGLLVEQAACQIAWGGYFRKLDDRGAAQKALHTAITIGRDVAPDIVWQAQAGLAALAEDAGNSKEALSHYRLMKQALRQLRHDIWQPALGGHFLKRPVSALDRAVRLAVETGTTRDILDFIEASKAQVVANLLRMPISGKGEVESPELENLVADIRWRQDRIRALSGNTGWLQSTDIREMRQEIKGLVAKYDYVRGQMERKNRTAEHAVVPAGNKFELAQFRKAAQRAYGDKWLALDYYLTEDSLACIIVTSQTCELVDMGYPGFVRMIFAGSGNAQITGQWPDHELKALGKWLLPDVVLNKLSPETVLFIAPHKQLHYLPWPALSAAGDYLIELALPVIVPSLQSLSILMERSDKKLSVDKGLLLAVSDFGERYDPLPQTVNEVAALEDLYPESKVLSDKAATWSVILELAGESGLNEYSYLHIASHGFADNVSGRLSGIALYDRDVLLDEFWSCAPLPPLITLSACSGSQSKLYEGDEQVGLATTCLSAGARHVVANLWPVHDENAPALMINFYSHLQRGYGVAHALAEAQRTAVMENKRIAHWAGYRCTGLPG